MIDLMFSALALFGGCYNEKAQSYPMFLNNQGAFYIVVYGDKRFEEVVDNAVFDLNWAYRDRFNLSHKKEVAENFIKLIHVHRVPLKVAKMLPEIENDKLPEELIPMKKWSEEERIYKLHEKYKPEHFNNIHEMAFGYPEEWYEHPVNKFEWRGWAYGHAYPSPSHMMIAYEGDIIINQKKLSFPLYNPKEYFVEDLPEPNYSSSMKFRDEWPIHQKSYIPMWAHIQFVVIHEILHAAVGLKHNTTDPENIMWEGSPSYKGVKYYYESGFTLNGRINNGEGLKRAYGNKGIKLDKDQWDAIKCLYY